MTGFPHVAVALLTPVAGMILSVSVFCMPLWHCSQDYRYRIKLPDEFRKCQYGCFIGFSRKEGPDSWKPVFCDREFSSEAELATAVRQETDGRELPIEINAPPDMPVSVLYRTLRSLDKAGVLQSNLNCYGSRKRE